DNSWSVYYLDLATGTAKKVAEEKEYFDTDVRTPRPAWSPDSNWITFTLGNGAAYGVVYVYSLPDGKAQAVTDGMNDAPEPCFAASGKYLYSFAPPDSGPVTHSFNLSSRDMRATRTPYLALLREDTPSPLARESDEEKAGGNKPPAETPAGAAAAVRIDF